MGDVWYNLKFGYCTSTCRIYNVVLLKTLRFSISYGISLIKLYCGLKSILLPKFNLLVKFISFPQEAIIIKIEEITQNISYENITRPAFEDRNLGFIYFFRIWRLQPSRLTFIARFCGNLNILSVVSEYHIRKKGHELFATGSAKARSRRTRTIKQSTRLLTLQNRQLRSFPIYSILFIVHSPRDGIHNRLIMQCTEST